MVPLWETITLVQSTRSGGSPSFGSPLPLRGIGYNHGPPSGDNHGPPKGDNHPCAKHKIKGFFFFKGPLMVPLCPVGASGTIMAPLRGTIMRFAHAWLCFFFRTRKRAQKKSHLLVPRRGPLCLAQEKWLRPLLPSCRIRAACAFIILCANKRL